MPKKTLFILYDVMLKYIYAKKCMSQFKNKNKFKNWLKWFLFFTKFVVITKHCDSIWLE
jgi:hypothetical protein